jgi:hypothetical protein
VIDGEFSGGGRILYVKEEGSEKEEIIEMKKGGWKGSFFG